MGKIITNGSTKIGAYQFADRKKPCLCVEKGNTITVYGTFNNTESADNFMSELSDFLGIERR
jgi:hypothetical protein